MDALTVSSNYSFKFQFLDPILPWLLNLGIFYISHITTYIYVIGQLIHTSRYFRNSTANTLWFDQLKVPESSHGNFFSSFCSRYKNVSFSR